MSEFSNCKACLNKPYLPYTFNTNKFFNISECLVCNEEIAKCYFCSKIQKQTLMSSCYGHSGRHATDFICSDCSEYCSVCKELRCKVCMEKCCDCNKKICHPIHEQFSDCGKNIDYNKKAKVGEDRIKCTNCRNLHKQNHIYLYKFFLYKNTPLIPDMINIICDYFDIDFESNPEQDGDN